MKSLTPLKLLGLTVLLLSLASVSLYAQATPAAQDPAASTPTAAQSQPVSQDQAGQPAAQQPQTFMGKIVRSNGGLVLRDQATNAEYKLDNEDQAKQFEGKSVKVTGTLDSASPGACGSL